MFTAVLALILSLHSCRASTNETTRAVTVTCPGAMTVVTYPTGERRIRFVDGTIWFRDSSGREWVLER